MQFTDEKFDGKCVTCGAQAAIQPTTGTALIQQVDNGRLSAIRTDLAVCERGHEYYIMDWMSKVEDPWLEGENPLEDGVELPPPPEEFE